MRSLAVACGIQLSYRDMNGHIKRAIPDGLTATLRALGINIPEATDAPRILERLNKKRYRHIIDPVTLAWNGRLSGLDLRISVPFPQGIDAKMLTETGETRLYRWDDLERFIADKSEPANPFRHLRLPFSEHLPLGYHRMTLTIGKTKASTLVIAAPRRAPSLTAGTRRWGLFTPLYALRSATSHGAVDISDFLKLARWSASRGGSIVATLPLLPAFYKELFNPSPYSPVSRLFWNEFYIDLRLVPEVTKCPEATALFDSPECAAEREALSSLPVVDYSRQMALKRRILEITADYFFQRGDESRQRAYVDYLTARSDLEDYARFRAISDELKIPWQQWPEKLRSGLIEETDCRPELLRYYLYTQFIAHEQMAYITAQARELGQVLYLDLPLGANPDGYDAWRYREIFAGEATVGAPPDPAFTGGQDWGFPPMHPVRLRESGYRYFIEVVRHHLRLAGILRLDHIMGLHRLFWIPAGLTARDGIYVRYEAEEMYAIFCLEAVRSNSVIVGEDLGLVPEPVRWAMRRHHVDRSYVAQYQMISGDDNCLEAIPVHAVAAVNTHDMHPFSAFWQGIDIDERQACGVLRGDLAANERYSRGRGKEALIRCLRRRNLIGWHEPSATEVYQAICRVLAGSDAEILLLSLDDLSGSTQAQNIPGTCTEHPNWQRRSALTLEQFEADSGIAEFLKDIDLERRRR